ncbi:hypothetical protein [Croceimicrobium sp.]|uniref:hypothetical protein n=1 Tax=Croceimicrobium sp. TaxID=2828340 RepID=UPI003BAA138D
MLAQKGPAVLIDSLNFIEVRNGPGMQFHSIDTLYKDANFYYQLEDESVWACLSPWKGSQMEGFIPRSSIQDLSALDRDSLKGLILEVLDRQRVLADSLNLTLNGSDSLNSELITEVLNQHTDTKFNPILQLIPDYFCTSKDLQLIDKLIATIWVNLESVNEEPLYSLGACFICQPELLMKSLDKITNTEQKETILKQIEWALLNHFEMDESGSSNNPNFKTIMDRLNAD